MLRSEYEIAVNYLAKRIDFELKQAGELYCKGLFEAIANNEFSKKNLIHDACEVLLNADAAKMYQETLSASIFDKNKFYSGG